MGSKRSILKQLREINVPTCFSTYHIRSQPDGAAVKFEIRRGNNISFRESKRNLKLVRKMFPQLCSFYYNFGLRSIVKFFKVSLVLSAPREIFVSFSIYTRSRFAVAQ